jgi:plasmid maintenance system antidote protein VapI
MAVAARGGVLADRGGGLALQTPPAHDDFKCRESAGISMTRHIVEKEEPNDASAKVLFLQRNVLPRRFGSKNTQKDLAEKTGVPRKTLNDQLNKTKRLSPAVQSALAKAFDFSLDWPEWKMGSAAEFEKRYKSQHPDYQPAAPPRPTNARLSKGPRQLPMPSKIKGLVAVEIDGSQFGPGTAAIEAMISCGTPIVLHAYTTIKRGRIKLKCGSAMLTKNALDGWLCKPRQVTGTCGSVHIAFEAGTRDMAGWRLTAEGASIGTIVLDPDFAALEELAPGDEITLEFGTWLPDIEDTGSASAADPPPTTDGLALVDGQGGELAVPPAEVSKMKQRIIACIRKGLLPADNSGYVVLASHVLKVVEAIS